MEQGGRTGLTAVTVAALVLVGGMMLRNVQHLAWDDYTELLPSFLVLLGIPLSYSIADGLALGFIAYPPSSSSGRASRSA